MARGILRKVLPGAALILGMSAAACVSGPARSDRDWHPYLAQTAHVSRQAESVSISPVSDWSYSREGETGQRYIEVSFRPQDLREIWFVLEPQPGSSLAAHTFLLFEFEDDRLLSLTIEARREREERYSALRGIFNAFELSYVWGTARDFLTRRAVMLDHDIYVYPVSISDAQKQVLLMRLLERTDRLEREPRYYNTLFSNCTNELAKAAGLHWAPAYILTGASDEYLYQRGIIPGDSFAEAQRRADVTRFVQNLNEQPASAFDAALLAELRRRNGA